MDARVKWTVAVRRVVGQPRYGAYVVAAWLGLIVVNLLSYSGFYDIALRDFGLVLAALTLARLGPCTTLRSDSGEYRQGLRPSESPPRPPARSVPPPGRAGAPQSP